MSKRMFAILILLVGLVVLLFPFSTVNIPEWQVKLVDGNGNPVGNVLVEQEWSHYAFLGSEYETLTADANGNITFPERRFFCPLLFRFVFRSLDTFSYIVMPHGARVGVYSRITTKAGTYYWLEYSENSSHLEHKLVVRKISG